MHATNIACQVSISESQGLLLPDISDFGFIPVLRKQRELARQKPDHLLNATFLCCYGLVESCYSLHRVILIASGKTYRGSVIWTKSFAH